MNDLTKQLIKDLGINHRNGPVIIPVAELFIEKAFKAANQSALQKAAKAICLGCRMDYELFNDGALHRFLKNDYMPCEAQAICTLMEKA